MSATDDKRLRREIANSNERRRMQSINAGFIGLRQLLPLSEGEKLSKAAILQLTAKYINVLSQEKSRLLQQNNKLKEMLQQQAAGSCAFSAGRANTTVTLGDESVTNATVSDSAKDAPTRTGTAGCTSARVSVAPEHEAPVTSVVAQEVTVGDAPPPVSARTQAQVLTQTGLHDAQMNLPLRKRKRTFSLSVEASVTPAPKTELPAGTDLAGTGTCTDSGGDTDADAYSGAPSSASAPNRTCGTARPRDVPTSSAASDADSVAMTTDRYRFVPSAPLPSAPVRDAKSDPNEPVAAFGVTNSYGGTMLLSANAPNQAPFRFDVITSVQTPGLVLSAASNAQRYEGVPFEPSYSSVVSPPVALCSSGVHQAPPASVECSSTSITKKNLETIFEAIRHLEGDDLSLGESPCTTQPSGGAKYQQRVGNVDTIGSKQMPQPSAVVNAASTMLVPLATSDAAQTQTAFLVCLSPANLALSPSSGHASAEFAQNTGVSFNMGAALNTMMSPVSVGVTGTAPRYVSSRAQQLLVNVPGAAAGELDPTVIAYPAAAVTCGGLPPTSRHV